MNPRTSRRAAPERSTPLWARFSILGALVGAMFALFAGCGLSTGGIPSRDGGAACTMAAECDDGNPCTTDTCSANGTCQYASVADGPAAPADQPTGNCKQILCASGKPSTVNDDANTPTPPNDCQTGSCNGGTPNVSDDPDGTTCILMGAQGSCGAGVCLVTCTTTAMCPSTNPCQTPNCDGTTGTCVYTNVADGTPTPGVTSPVGSCHTHLCLGGMDQNTVDDSNVPIVPAAMAGCADGVCTNGTPSVPLHATESPCTTYMMNQSGVCNAAGLCVQCVAAKDCPGVTDDCQSPSCTNQLCGTSFTAAGTPTTATPAQVKGTCHQTVCLGSVQNNVDYQTVVDDNNPPSSGSPCITDTCSNGSVVMTINPNPTTIACGTISGQTEYCSSQGECGCQTDTDCTYPSTCSGGGISMVCGCTPKTCTAIGKTCGGPFSDQCYGMLSCDTGTQNGQETDVDCGGPTSACATRCANGKKCNAGSDCASGFCADGVCCNTACTGITCEACSDAAKGTTGQDGVCGAVVSGKDPHNDCMMQSASTCGESGGCNGSGACSTYAAGTQCVAASCAGTATLTKASTCAGNGGPCNGNGTQSCAPGTCSNGACSNGCATDMNCDPTAYCNNGTCTPRLPAGQGCTSGDQCQSTFCVNNVCCGTGSCPQCQACSNSLTGQPSGTCANINANTADPVNACANQGAQTCGTDGLCDGTGHCQKYADGTACASAGCTTTAGVSTETAAATCSGGNCSPTSMSCGNYACNGATCRTSCTQDTDCAANDWCSGSACVAKLSNGAAGCGSDNGACSSGHCVTGTCCSANCTAGSGGACGETGLCNSSTGNCAEEPATTTCSMPTACSNGMQTAYTTCSGSGSCSGSATMTPCGAYACNGNGTACNTKCSGAGTGNGCANGNYYCTGSNGTCMAQGGTAAACSQNYQCVSKICVAGVCT